VVGVGLGDRDQPALAPLQHLGYHALARRDRGPATAVACESAEVLGEGPGAGAATLRGVGLLRVAGLGCDEDGAGPTLRPGPQVEHGQARGEAQRVACDAAGLFAVGQALRREAEPRHGCAAVAAVQRRGSGLAVAPGERAGGTRAQLAPRRGELESLARREAGGQGIAPDDTQGCRLRAAGPDEALARKQQLQGGAAAQRAARVAPPVRPVSTTPPPSARYRSSASQSPSASCSWLGSTQAAKRRGRSSARLSPS
jgi:hypothetical protein